jgi:hypothetical protein
LKVIMGIPWCEERDYPRILEIMDDADRLPATFASWLKKAEKAEREFKRHGHDVVRAVIDPDRFPAWCHSHGLKRLDAQARIAFASYVAAGKA